MNWLEGITLLFIFTTCDCKAQIVSDTLHEVKITTCRKRVLDIKNLYQTYTVNKDSIGKMDVLGILQNAFPIHFQTGGLNDYASISIRGASMAQTLVTWNGIPFNSPLSGIGDVSTLGDAGGAVLALNTGGSGAWFGNHAIGGHLGISSQIDSARMKIEWGGRVGSFSRKQTYLNWSNTHQKLKYQFQANFENSLNNYEFPYKKYYPWLLKANENGALQSFSVLATIEKKSKHIQHKFDFWQFFRHRGLSPQINAFNQKASIQDQFTMGVYKADLDYKYFYTKFIVGYSHNQLSYNNPYYHLENLNQFNQWNFIVDDLNINRKGFQNFYFQMKYQFCNSNWSLQNYSFASTALFYKWTVHKHHGYISNTFLNYKNALKSLPSINYYYQPNLKWQAGLNVQYIYKLPTYNELYFVPGGNDKLKPEDGISGEAKVSFKNKSTAFQISTYQRVVKNWIVWYGSLVWSPHNMTEVTSRGMEFNFEQSVQPSNFSNWQFNFTGNYAKSVVTKVESQLFVDFLGKRIPYIPSLTLKSQLSWTYLAKFKFELSGNIQSKKFTTPDESNYIKGFATMDFKSYYIFSCNRLNSKITFAVNNLTNSYYMTIYDRPMPGRYYELGWTMMLKK